MEEIYYPQMRNPNSISSTTTTTSNLYHLPPQDDFFDFSAKMNSTSVTSPSLSRHSVAHTQSTLPSSLSNEADSLQQLKQGLGKVLSSMERLEQRISRLEQSTNQILKNQQEVLQVPFMSQTDIDRARQAAEQIEQDTNVAKQLQAAYNKEIELKKSMTTSMSYAPRLADCPICGVKVSTMEMEVHVDQCLELFSDDPKKETQIQETKKKMETGFFGRLFKTTTKTETTKVVSTQAPTSQRPESQSMYPGYGYPPYANMPQNTTTGQNGMPMMMPMYMYPAYPQMTQLDNQ